MTIDVLLSGEAVPIDEAVFKLLLDNSVAGTYVDYELADLVHMNLAHMFFEVGRQKGTVQAVGCLRVEE